MQQCNIIDYAYAREMNKWKTKEQCMRITTMGIEVTLQGG